MMKSSQSKFLQHVQTNIEALIAVGDTSVFTIATTSKAELHPYCTPVRTYQSFSVSGCVIFEQDCLIELIRLIDGRIDYVLVDTEKKIPLSIHSADQSHESDLYHESNTIGEVETGNLSKICFQRVKSSVVYEYKPNDLTVNAAWSFLSQRLGILSGKKMAILGAGNIGSKLALKLVECGVEVHTYRTQKHVGAQIAYGLNYIKHENTVSNIISQRSILPATFMSDVVIGAASGFQVITVDVLKSLKKGALIIDLGKNNITPDAIQFAVSNAIEIYRVDVNAALEGFVTEMFRMQDILKNSYGKTTTKDGVSIVSGGYFGSKGDIVVDSISQPTRIIGVSNGDGLLKQELTDTDLASITSVEKGVLNV